MNRFIDFHYTRNNKNTRRWRAKTTGTFKTIVRNARTVPTDTETRRLALRVPRPVRTLYCYVSNQSLSIKKKKKLFVPVAHTHVILA